MYILKCTQLTFTIMEIIRANILMATVKMKKNYKDALIRWWKDGQPYFVQRQRMNKLPYYLNDF